jgi:hypothetical protein
MINRICLNKALAWSQERRKYTAICGHLPKKMKTPGRNRPTMPARTGQDWSVKPSRPGIFRSTVLVYGTCSTIRCNSAGQVKDAAGNETHKNKVTAFCRCGASSNKPYRDGIHRKIAFEG